MPLTANAAFTERHQLRTIEVTPPAAGNFLTYVIPDNSVFQVVGVRFRLTTSDVAGERWPSITILDNLGMWPIQASVTSWSQRASLAWVYWFSCGIAPVNATADDYAMYSPLACGLQLRSQERVWISWSNMDALDAIDQIYLRVYGWKED